MSWYLRNAPGDPGPHLDKVPVDPVGRHSVAKYVAAQLEGGRTMTMAEVRDALWTTHRNVRVLIALLLGEGFLERTDGRRDVFRVGVPRTSAPSMRARR
ncbi:MAG TPA: DUF2087 domain-containing protein [Acidimicrobiales bacterium]|nr:DUF2087 domain-containing protein [Acidimicrobiales bacterium]